MMNGPIDMSGERVNMPPTDGLQVIPEAAVEAAARIIYRTSGRKRVMSYEEARANCREEARAILEATTPHTLAGIEWGVFRASDDEHGEPIENRRYKSRETAQRMIDQGYNQSNIWEVRGHAVGEWSK